MRVAVIAIALFVLEMLVSTVYFGENILQMAALFGFKAILSYSAYSQAAA